ncbi:hypothetical protein NUW54_g523 [Trametes sanguinea]|uniref:Uncharacterized protein n=2 Tax=Trametes sanguinea TaxID=158606 RepID=A0ACC1Q860_9APHY|nr:hypothetical protein NUW54_g1645 [Trametes sanguinea]KAJ3017700.1 hypothetical protein NUW54_g523 [Trametes sanguinea]
MSTVDLVEVNCVAVERCNGVRSTGAGAVFGCNVMQQAGHKTSEALLVPVPGLGMGVEQGLEFLALLDAEGE